MTFFGIVIGVYSPYFLERLDFCNLISDITNEKNPLFGAVSLPRRRIYDYTYTSSSSQSDSDKRKQEHFQKINNWAESQRYDRVSEERFWRLDLKEGDMVDCINKSNVSSNRVPKNIVGWTRGQIYEVDEDRLKIRFIQRSKTERLICDRQDETIAPLGTFTDDIDWKSNLQKGDYVDVCDQFAEWYKSTVVDCYYSKETDMFEN